MTDTTEAEARLEVQLSIDELASPALVDAGPAEDRLADALDAYAEAVRATEREKVRALVTILAEEMLNMVDGEWECFHCAGIAHYFSPFDLYIDHTEDCPWVEARLWLDGGAE